MKERRSEGAKNDELSKGGAKKRRSEVFPETQFHTQLASQTIQAFRLTSIIIKSYSILVFRFDLNLQMLVSFSNGAQ